MEAKVEVMSNFCILRSMTSRSYNQYCGLAYALDIVGERWTLLIIRELIAGPRRFKDLMVGLPDISTNLLAERLKHLEQQGILRRRVLPPPAGSTVYELTALGQALEKTLLELGKWGSQFVPPSMEGATVLRLGSYALTFKTFFRPDQAQGVDETYALHIDNEVLQVQIKEGEIHVQQGETRRADVVFHTDMPSFLGLFSGQINPDEAISGGLIRIEGDPSALRRFLHICGLPGAHEGSSVTA
ncbi:MAG: winged helix-turn-helix transcriptional regulator [Chloroflexota bacterium]|nr:winged helix-turn-helix transcriptional regulator [Chloroflexota bacterium]